MRPALRRAGLACLLAAAAAACATGAEPAAPDSEVARAVLGPPPPGASVLRIGVTPSAAVPLSYEARLEWGDGPAERVVLGRFALHPADQPGRFLLRVPAEALRHAAAGARPLRLVLTARAIDDRPLRAAPAPVAASAAWAPDIR